MVQIIPKDIHIRKWERFQVDLQLKFLTWSFMSSSGNKQEELWRIIIWAGRIIIWAGRIIIRAGRIIIRAGRIIIWAGRIIIWAGRIIIWAGRIIIQTGRIIIRAGRIIIWAGRIIIWAGRIIIRTVWSDWEWKSTSGRLWPRSWTPPSPWASFYGIAAGQPFWLCRFLSLCGLSSISVFLISWCFQWTVFFLLPFWRWFRPVWCPARTCGWSAGAVPFWCAWSFPWRVAEGRFQGFVWTFQASVRCLHLFRIDHRVGSENLPWMFLRFRAWVCPYPHRAPCSWRSSPLVLWGSVVIASCSLAYQK